MNILCVGDIVGKAGRDILEEHLHGLKSEYDIDFTIVNGENSAGGFGITTRIANQILSLGVDVITLGDHVWDKKEIAEYLIESDNMIRPANFPPGTPGDGWVIAKSDKGTKIGVINLLGRVFMRYNVECPFRKLESIIKEIKKETNIIILDFHAETTSEKVALGFFADGKLSGIVGTHTHIPTADAHVLPKGTAYITDMGMTGPYDSVIGQNKDIIIERFVNLMPNKFEVATEGARFCGVVIDVDEKTGKARQITPIQRSS